MTHASYGITSIFMIIGLVLLAALYFLPSIIGRKKQNAGAIFVLNLLLGWTLLGWVGALVWACTKEPDSPQVPRS